MSMKKHFEHMRPQKYTISKKQTPFAHEESNKNGVWNVDLKLESEYSWLPVSEYSLNIRTSFRQEQSRQQYEKGLKPKEWLAMSFPLV